MKTSTYRHLLMMTFLMLLFISMPSCTTEATFEEEGNGFILVSLNNIRSRAGSLFADEDLIEKVRILVFFNGDIEKNEVFTSDSNNLTNPFQVEVITGTKDIYVIANETIGLTSSLTELTSVRELKGLLTETINSPLRTPLMMIGSIPSVSVIKGQANLNDIALERIAAKIQLKFRKQTTDDVRIKKVTLHNNTGKSPLINGGVTISGSQQSYWSYAPAIGNLVLNENATSIPGSEAIYVYENLTGGEKTNATQLEVEASYNGLDTKYAIYINEDVFPLASAGNSNSSVTSPNDHLYSLKRNYAYVLTGTITGMGEFDGLDLEATVLSWTKVSSSVLFDWVFEISPKPTSTNYIYLMDSSNQTSFTFKLTNPLEASWTANLTNESDFEITSIRNGVTNQEVAITVRAKNIPSSSISRETELYISALLGGNFTEIPLLTGSTLIGAGNRVKIIQPEEN